MKRFGEYCTDAGFAISSFVCKGSGLKHVSYLSALPVEKFLPLFVKEVD
nr:hypothetical protein [Leptospira noguchii]